VRRRRNASAPNFYGWDPPDVLLVTEATRLGSILGYSSADARAAWKVASARYYGATAADRDEFVAALEARKAQRRSKASARRATKAAVAADPGIAAQIAYHRAAAKDARAMARTFRLIHGSGTWRAKSKIKEAQRHEREIARLERSTRPR